MRKLSTFFSVLLLALAVSACDTTEDELDESEVFIGSWTVVEVNDEEGDKTDVFQQGITEFSATIDVDTYDLLVDFVDPQRADVSIEEGSYTLNEGSNTLTLMAPITTPPTPVPFRYEIESEDRIHLTLSNALVVGLFGASPDTYEGEVTFTVERQ